MKKRLILPFIGIFTLLSFHSGAQYDIIRIEPPFWWTGMKNSELQIMVYGPAISELKPTIAYPGVTLDRTILVQNPNYLFLILHIDPDTNPGVFLIEFKKNDQTILIRKFSLFSREQASSERSGFNNSDVIYLITPDRFANGDPANDRVAGYADTLDRSNPQARHGGDLQGIINHLDYIAGMGFTAIWLNPVLENAMPRTSYHGYAITDFYKVDPRFGNNELYRQLSEACKEKGIKLIMDMVMNHCGSQHWWMKDLPSDDWIHNHGKFISTNHRRSVVQDPYAAPSEKALFHNGWFVSAMPDMNQKNPLLAQYLIQNSIWWIEYAHLQGIRHDTHSYPDKDFMSDWSCAIMDEYPDFNIVGEEWSPNPAIIAYWQRGKDNPDGYTSCMPSMMDFPTQMTLVKSLNQPEGWNSGFINLYEILASDFLYADPYSLVIFPDNHDMSRFYTQVNEDFDLWKMGIAYILTMRGIPQIYYGTEILKTSPGERNDGLIRSDFPGGWVQDEKNGFSGVGLTEKQHEAQSYLKTLLSWRKTKSCVQSGELIHYIPVNSVYTYFRYDENGMVMVVLNKNENDMTLDTEKFSEVTGNKTTGRDAVTGKQYKLDDLQVPARSALVLELN